MVFFISPFFLISFMYFTLPVSFFFYRGIDGGYILPFRAEVVCLFREVAGEQAQGRAPPCALLDVCG